MPVIPLAARDCLATKHEKFYILYRLLTPTVGALLQPSSIPNEAPELLSSHQLNVPLLLRTAARAY